MTLEFGASRAQFIDHDWYLQDLEAVFRPRWHFAAHADQLPRLGSYVTFTIGADELVVIRRANGKLGVYKNFCRHRGHRLFTTDHGELTRNIMCQYHGWSYSKDSGACLGATRMNADFDRSQWGLRTAWVEEFHGLIYVCVADEQPTSVAEATSHLVSPEAGFGGFDVGRMKLAAMTEFEIGANWKVVKENDDECYHCTLNHPELIAGYDPWGGPTVIPDDGPDQGVWTTEEWALLELGFRQSVDRVCEIAAPRVSGGVDFQATDAHFAWQSSGHMIAQSDHAWIWTLMPAGPETTLTRQWWLVHPDAEEGKDYEVASLRKLFDTTMRQDKVLCEEVQRGVRMRGYTPGPLNPTYQAPAAAWYEWYRKRAGSAAVLSQP